MAKLIFLTSLCASWLISSGQDPDVRNIAVLEDDVLIKAHVLISKYTDTLNFELVYYWFDGDQIKRSKGNFNGYLLHGTFKSVYRDKEPRENGYFHYGLKDGNWTLRNEYGKIREMWNWNMGVLDGTFKIYNKNSVLVKSGSYKNGELHGLVTEYDGERIITQHVYLEGVIVVDSLQDQ